MNSNFPKILYIFSFCFLFGITAQSQSNGKIKVIIDGLRNNAGTVGIRLFDQAKGFPSEAGKALKEFFVNPINGEAILEINNMTYGIYAIGCMHDENNNKIFDTNFFGIPKEGFGTSNNPKALFGPPSFNDAKFELREGIVVIIIKMVYF